MRGPEKAHALQLKRFADERIQIRAGHNYVAPQDTGRFIHERKGGAKVGENFLGEKSDLAFVVVLKVVEAVAANAVAGHAFEAIDFLEWIIVRGASVMAEIVMAG